MTFNVQQRAQYGLKTIEAYRSLIGRERGVVDEDAVTDMLTDLWHMCESLGIDMRKCHTAALLHFCAEKEGVQ